jgi:DNA end-binding protein Ku
MVMRTTWNGSISFGLVNIPVGLAPATKPAARQSDVSFRLLHRECGTPIKQKRWCTVHDREVGPDEIVKGWEVAKGEFVMIEDADLEALEHQDTSRSIEITQFVALADVDPVFFDRTYYLAPAANAAARRPYVLLLNAMNETGRAALGRFVLAGKEKLVLIRARGEALALETLFLAEDVYPDAEITEAIEGIEVKDAELALAQQIIDSLAGDFDPAALTSDYRRDLKAMLEAKLAGTEIARPEEPVAEDAQVVDLMEALRKSVADAKERNEGASGSSKPKAAPKSGSRARRAPARKSA